MAGIEFSPFEKGGMKGDLSTPYLANTSETLTPLFQRGESKPSAEGKIDRRPSINRNEDFV
jgi:hypothetical protein